MSDRHERPYKSHRQGAENFLAETGCQAELPGTFYFEVRKFSVTLHVAAYPAS
jgi:hypothetical protein